MTKQEEIREGMRSHLNRLYTRCFGKEPEGIALAYIEHCLKNQEWWLVSQGVAIELKDESIFHHGYFPKIEPLIEEG